MQAPGLDEEDGGSPTNNKGPPSARREGRVKGKQEGADREPGAAVPGATLRMSEWPPNDQEVWASETLIGARTPYILHFLRFLVCCWPALGYWFSPVSVLCELSGPAHNKVL